MRRLSQLSVQAKNDKNRCIDAPLFLGAETSSEVTEAIDADRPHLLNEHVGDGAIDFDLGSE